MMMTHELRAHLVRLIDSYVTEPTVKTQLSALVAKHNVPVKGILAELEPFLSGTINPVDAKLVKDIAFHFC
jgi:hypothetical protein